MNRAQIWVLLEQMMSTRVKAELAQQEYERLQASVSEELAKVYPFVEGEERTVTR